MAYKSTSNVSDGTRRSWWRLARIYLHQLIGATSFAGLKRMVYVGGIFGMVKRAAACMAKDFFDQAEFRQNTAGFTKPASCK